MSATRIAGAAVLLGALLTTAGCGLNERIDPCGVLFDELDAVHAKMAAPQDTINGGYKALSAADAAFFRDAASKIRRVGRRLDKDGPAESRKVAAEIDKIADSLSALPAGAKSAKYSEAVTGGGIYINNETLKAACGYPPGAF
ncbi:MULTISPECIES: hypothetical protein [Actinomadura]|uniref:hypothetical protein n=1 Tax=Actinomadura TaxID=1988 RepID=UPI0003ACDA2F|nr:hypothetical protein [Actinomadura madurae]SPT63358.1 Uncharacterised protein [Actinomadura madurae]